MMAFFCVFVSLLIIILIFHGRTLRKFNLLREPTEDGIDVVSGARDSQFSVDKLSG